MKLEKIDLYYFSGTGNTLLVVKQMMKVLIEKGVDVKLHKLEDSKPEDVNTDHVIGLGFPVAILSTYNFVWNFIKWLPKVDGTPIFMVDTLGGYSGGIVGPLRSIVEKKGYKPIGACEIIMPSNIFFIPDGKTCDEKVRNGLVKAEKYALSLVDGSSKWGRVPLLSDAVNALSLGLLKLADEDIHQKYIKFRADKSRCNKCGIFVDICPVGNIKLDDFPVTGNNCQYCLRCVSFCPRSALPCIFNYKGKTYRAVDVEDFRE